MTREKCPRCKSEDKPTKLYVIPRLGEKKDNAWAMIVCPDGWHNG